MKFIVFTVLLLAAGGGAYYYKTGLDAKAAKAAEIDAQPKTMVVEKGTIDLKVSTTGRVISNLDVEIKSKASGQIIRLPYDVSDTVTSGDLLAELDPIDEMRNVSQRESALSSAKARLSQAEENLKMAQVDLDTGTSEAMAQLDSARVKMREAQAKLMRQEDLFQKKLISREELDVARSETAAAERALTQAEVAIVDTKKLPRVVELRKHDVQLQLAAVKSAEVDLQNAFQRLTETKLFAPMDGVITSRPVQTGQIIASGISNVGGGTTLMTLSDLSRLFVSANVDESDIGKVRVDQSTRITADAYPGKRFRGKVTRVAAKGQNNSNVVTFEVKIEVEGEGRNLLKPEMTTNVEIQADRREDVVVLPNEVVQFGKEGYYVELPGSTPEKPNRKVIKTGLTDGLNTEILEGLAEGDTVKLPTSVQSRWARSEGDQRSGSERFTRGMQSATFRLSGGGRRGGR